MPRAHSQALARRQRRAAAAAAVRARRLAGLVLLAAVALVTLLLTAFGSGHTATIQPTGPAPATRLLPSGPPRPQVVAVLGTLRVQLPIAQSRVTQIGYHGAGDGALPLSPLGHQGNEGFLARIAHRLFGGTQGGLRYFQLSGGGGPATAALDVGAPAGTDVFSPVDGTIVGMTPFVVNGRILGTRMDIQPSAAPSLVLTLTHLRPDPALTVGSSVAAVTSKLGTVVNFAGVERQALAQFTQDAGNHLELLVRPAPVSLP
jgi:hypothetical protein